MTLFSLFVAVGAFFGGLLVPAPLKVKILDFVKALPAKIKGLFGKK